MTNTEGRTSAEGRPVINERMASLYQATWGQVFRYAFELVRHREDAEDAAAEAFARAHKAWLEGKGPVGPGLPWLLLITRRIVIDRARRRRLIAWLPLVASSDRPGNPGIDDLAKAEVWLWFDQLSRLLPPRQREAVLLRYQFDLPDAEIGMVLGVSPAGARTLVFRAMNTLRAQPEMFR